MPRRRGAGKAAQETSGAEATDGARYPIRQIRQFANALDALGVPKKPRVLAELQQFEIDWQGNELLEVLRGKYEYKPVAANDACRRAKVRQIRPTNDTRVLLAIVDAKKTVYLLDVFHKSVTTQHQAIARACERARKLHEGAYGRTD